MNEGEASTCGRRSLGRVVFEGELECLRDGCERRFIRPAERGHFYGYGASHPVRIFAKEDNLYLSSHVLRIPGWRKGFHG